MVDEKKTILMTKLAIFEKHEKNKSLVVSKYYRSDYVRYNVLKNMGGSDSTILVCHCRIHIHDI